MTTVEVITFKLKEGADEAKFMRENDVVAKEYTPKQPGYISRELGKGDDGEWVVVVHWEDNESAEASMKIFPNDPTAQEFISLMDMDTFRMVRYEVVG